ncbi:TolB family protein [Amycolatopsis sp. WGS_07]|uniref:TolB family protein n=1 Tax=Amycolatopsis sp. WGS_07 TaxID=3076764 RepID=UPI0038733144
MNPPPLQLRSRSWSPTSSEFSAPTTLAAACSSPPEIAPPVIGGSLVVAGKDKAGQAAVWQVTEGAATPLLSGNTAPTLPAVALSPDGRTLAYVNGAGRIVLHDVAAGTEIVAQATVTDPLCATWAPDSAHVAITSEQGVTTADRKGAVAGLVTRPSGAYHETGPGSSGESRDVVSGMTCARWVDPDTVILSRYNGDLPSTIPASGALAPNTTVVGHVAAGTVQDLPEKEDLLHACQGHALLHRAPDPAVTGPTLLADASDLSRTTEVALGAGDTAWFFQPGTCALVVVSHTGDEDSYDYTVKLFDPATGQQRSSRTLPIALGGDSGIREPVGSTTFVPSPAPGALAAAYADANTHQLIVADLTTGGTRRLDGPWNEATQVLGWTASTR